MLVVDAGASTRCAVLGDNLAAMGVRNNWSVRTPCQRAMLRRGSRDAYRYASVRIPMRTDA